MSPWRQSWGWSLCEATGASRRGAERPGERPWAGSLPSLGLRPPEEVVGPVALWGVAEGCGAPTRSRWAGRMAGTEPFSLRAASAFK